MWNSGHTKSNATRSVTTKCQLKPQEREQTLQGLLRTLNYIALQNQGAKMTYCFDVEEERSIAAEEE